MPSIKVPTMYVALNERRERLRHRLTDLTSENFTLVQLESSVTEEDLPRAIIRSSIRVRRTDYRFSVLEDFRDSAGIPFLYAFKYSLQSPDPTLEPIFRYECHPDVEDPSPDDEENETEDAEDRRNPYSEHPHFHPHSALDFPLSRLHYPFHRSQRPDIIFHLISWVDRDLVKRFYDSGRVRAAS